MQQSFSPACLSHNKPHHPQLGSWGPRFSDTFMAPAQAGSVRGYVGVCMKMHTHTACRGKSIKNLINKRQFSFGHLHRGDEQLLLWGQGGWGFMDWTLSLVSAVGMFPSSCHQAWALSFVSRSLLERLTLPFLWHRPVQTNFNLNWLCYPTENLPYSPDLIWYPCSLHLVTN